MISVLGTTRTKGGGKDVAVVIELDTVALELFKTGVEKIGVLFLLISPSDSDSLWGGGALGTIMGGVGLIRLILFGETLLPKGTISFLMYASPVRFLTDPNVIPLVINSKLF